MGANTTAGSARPDYDAIVVGGGFAGVYAVHRLRDQKGLRVAAFERAGSLGGVWYWNRYPGARCDIESLQYSYSFSPELEQEWSWSERYAAQPEILAYLNHVADRFDVRKEFRFHTAVTSMIWDETDALWAVTVSTGETYTARFVFACTGSLSVPADADFGGAEKFQGRILRTHDWPHEPVDLSGKRVGVIGTGASGVQVIAAIAREVGSLKVFQRTPAYAIPARNRPTDPVEEREWKARYRELRRAARSSIGGLIGPHALPSAMDVSAEERVRRYDELFNQGGVAFLLSTFSDLLVDERANATAAQYVRDHIASRVDDPEVAQRLSPTSYPIGTKRLPLEIGYYDAFNQDNVELVDVGAAPIQEITEAGLRTTEGEYRLDVIIFATGFDAITGALSRMGIVGRDGVALSSLWAKGPRTYLGIASHGLPNLFQVTGPLSAAAVYNNPLAIEDNVDFASDAVEYVMRQGCTTIEVSAEAEAAWCRMCTDIMNYTLFPKAKSWYLGDNIPGKPRTAMIYLGSAPEYRQICADVVAKGYEEFIVSGGRKVATASEAIVAADV